MNIKELLVYAVKTLEKTSNSAYLDSRLLLSHSLKISFEELILNYERIVKKEDKEIFLKLLSRRQNLEPIAYILEEQGFYKYKFYVNKNVLIPRPETELIIENFITDYKKNFNNQKIKILELGTGSGAIAVSLKKECNNLEITATDISENALNIAKKNADKNNTGDINFIKSDWYKSIPQSKFKYIISNPPYIDIEEEDIMSIETKKYEPHLALFSEQQGILSYKEIINQASKYLDSDGKILLEIGYNQGKKVGDILKEYNFNNFRIIKDLSNHDRLIIAQS